MVKRCLCCGARLDSYSILGLCHNCFAEIQAINETKEIERMEYEDEILKQFEDGLERRMVDEENFIVLDDPLCKPLNLDDSEYSKLVNKDIDLENFIHEDEYFKYDSNSEGETKTFDEIFENDLYSYL